MKFADRVTCMLKGRLVLDGTPDELGREEIVAAYFGVS
jgi:ABC-type hemin transport system ATPase subunit